MTHRKCDGSGFGRLGRVVADEFSVLPELALAHLTAGVEPEMLDMRLIALVDSATGHTVRVPFSADNVVGLQVVVPPDEPAAGLEFQDGVVVDDPVQLMVALVSMDVEAVKLLLERVGAVLGLGNLLVAEQASLGVDVEPAERRSPPLGIVRLAVRANDAILGHQVTDVIPNVAAAREGAVVQLLADFRVHGIPAASQTRTQETFQGTDQGGPAR